MNYRILLLTAMLAVSMQACQGGKSTEKAARANGATTIADKAAPGSGNGDINSQKTTGNELQGDCENPILMSVQSGEKEIKVSDLTNGKDGNYQLISTEYFVAFESDTEKGTIKNLHFLGSEITNDNNLKEEKTVDDKIEVLCASKAKDGSLMDVSGDMNMPNAFNSKDGVTHIKRQDKVQVKDGKTKVASILSPEESKIGNPDAQKPQGLKVLVVKKGDSEVTIKLQYDATDRNQNRSSITVATTYRLKE